MRWWIVAAAMLTVRGACPAAETARLTLTARDAAGRPVAGLWVYARAECEPAQHVDDDVRSDAQGRVVFEGLAPAPYRFHLHGQPYHEWDSGLVVLQPGDNALEAVLWPQDETTPGAIVDILVIGRDGRPAARTEVEVDTECAGLPPAPDQLRLGGLGMFLQLDRYDRSEVIQRGVMTTDGQGRLRFQAPPGPLKVAVTARREVVMAQPVWAPAGRVTSMRAHLAAAEPRGKGEPAPRPQNRVRCRVIDADGRPVANTLVRVAGRHGGPDGLPPRTDAQGWFEVTVAGAAPVLSVKVPGWCISPAESLDPQSAEPTVFTLTDRARRVAGQVLDSAGQPVPSAVAWALPIMDSYSEEPPHVTALRDDGDWGEALPGGQHAVRCQADGSFGFAELDDRVYRFLAWAPGWGQPTVTMRRPGLAAGEPLTLHLTSLARLAGRALKPDGTAWPGAPITLLLRDDREEMVSADAAGRWQWADLPPGRHVVQAFLPGCQAVRGEVSLVGGQETTWALRPGWGHTLSGQVVWADGRPAARVRLTCPMPHSLPRVAWTDDDGRFRLTGLRAGDRQLDITTARGQEPPRYVKAPQAMPLRLRLLAAASVAGRVVNAEGRPVPDARCSLSREAADDSIERNTDAQGRFSFDGLIPGRWSLSAHADYGYGPDIDLQLGDGEARRDVTVKLRPYRRASRQPQGTVTGRVVGTDGLAVRGVEVQWGGSSQDTVKTDAAGRFRLPTAGEKRVTLRIRDGRCHADDVTVTVRPGGEVTVPDIRLKHRLVTGRLVDVPPGIRAEDCTVELGIAALDAQGRLLPDSEACVLPMCPAGHQPPEVPEPRICDLGWLAFPTARAVRVGQPWVMPCGDDPPHARADGTFTVALEPGVQRLVVRLVRTRGSEVSRLTLADQVVDIPAAGPVEVALKLVAGSGTLHGFVAMGRRNEAVYDIEAVEAYRGESWCPVAVALTQPDGAWRMTGLPAGTYRLAVPGGWFGGQFVTVTLGEGQTLEVPQPAPGTLALRGRVTGQRPAGLAVTAQSETALRSVDVGRDGRFEFADMPAGRYHFTLWSVEARRVLRLPEPHAVPGPEIELAW